MKNNEGYTDLTAGIAMGKVMDPTRRAPQPHLKSITAPPREKWKKKEGEKKKIVYCSVPAYTSK